MLTKRTNLERDRLCSTQTPPCPFRGDALREAIKSLFYIGGLCRLQNQFGDVDLALVLNTLMVNQGTVARYLEETGVKERSSQVPRENGLQIQCQTVLAHLQPRLLGSNQQVPILRAMQESKDEGSPSRACLTLAKSDDAWLPNRYSIYTEAGRMDLEHNGVGIIRYANELILVKVWGATTKHEVSVPIKQFASELIDCVAERVREEYREAAIDLVKTWSLVFGTSPDNSCWRRVFNHEMLTNDLGCPAQDIIDIDQAFAYDGEDGGIVCLMHNTLFKLSEDERLSGYHINGDCIVHNTTLKLLTTASFITGDLEIAGFAKGTLLKRFDIFGMLREFELFRQKEKPTDRALAAVIGTKGLKRLLDEFKGERILRRIKEQIKLRDKAVEEFNFYKIFMREQGLVKYHVREDGRLVRLASAVEVGTGTEASLVFKGTGIKLKKDFKFQLPCQGELVDNEGDGSDHEMTHVKLVVVGNQVESVTPLSIRGKKHGYLPRANTCDQGIEIKYPARLSDLMATIQSPYEVYFCESTKKLMLKITLGASSIMMTSSASKPNASGHVPLPSKRSRAC